MPSIDFLDVTEKSYRYMSGKKENILDFVKKNKGFKTLRLINKIFNFESDENNFSFNLTAGQMSLFKYGSTTLCDFKEASANSNQYYDPIADHLYSKI